jgi:serine/threonine protein kinase
MTVASSAPGQRIADYWLHEAVPARSTENAYRATHRVLPRSARIAVVSAEFAGSRHAEVQLMREACVLETVHHAGVPRIYECGLHEQRPWVASEHITGAAIEQVAARRPLPVGDALAVVRDAAAILAHAHRRGVAHRDITPRSILRTAHRGFPVCIIGWGDAAVRGSALPRGDDPDARFYRAPEAADGEGGSGPADVFALGAVMFEAATLALPDPVQKFPGLPPAFHQLLAGMLARSPAARPTADALHDTASRLAELYSGADASIEEVEVELVDISRSPLGLPDLPGWAPPERLPRSSGTFPTHRLRKGS